MVNSLNSERLGLPTDELRAVGDVHGIVANLSEQSERDRLLDGTIRHCGGLDTLLYDTRPPRPELLKEQSLGERAKAASLLVVSQPIPLGGRPSNATFHSGGEVLPRNRLVRRSSWGATPRATSAGQCYAPTGHFCGP